MAEKCILLFILNLSCLTYGYSLAGPDHDKLVVCYYTSWTVYSPGAAKFEISDIEPSLCTHLIYGLAGLDNNSFKIKVLDKWEDLERDGGGIKRFVELKEKHKHLKTTISIGGWNEGSAKYSKMAADPKLRNIFIRSVVNFLDIHKLDGLDLYWDYPTGRGGKPKDRKNYVTLLKELSEALQDKGYILTATLRPTLSNLNKVYDLVNVNFYLDFIHLMTYDYHGAWDGVVLAHAPLRSKDKDDFLSVEYTIKYLLSHGVTSSKMILGLPMYGRTYILNNPEVKDIIFGEITTKTTGFSGRFSSENGFMGYNEICLEISNKSSEWIQYWDEDSSTPYLRDEGRIISYDNPRSIASKVKMAMDYGLGGFAAWRITIDDFRGSCDEDTDTYIDFIDRFNRMSNQPIFLEAIANLVKASNTRDFYLISSDKKPLLRLPKPKFANYPLLRTVHEAMSLVTEEKKVLDEMEKLRVQKEEIEKNSFPCIRTCTEVCYYGPENTQKKTTNKVTYEKIIGSPIPNLNINEIAMDDVIMASSV